MVVASRSLGGRYLRRAQQFHGVDAGCAAGWARPLVGSCSQFPLRWPQDSIDRRCTIEIRFFGCELMPAPTPSPTDIVLHTTSRVLEIAFDDGARFRLPFEFLRVYSPSAAVRGHGPGQETLQVGKRNVTIDELQPV